MDSEIYLHPYIIEFDKIELLSPVNNLSDSMTGNTSINSFPIKQNIFINFCNFLRELISCCFYHRDVNIEI